MPKGVYTRTEKHSLALKGLKHRMPESWYESHKEGTITNSGKTHFKKGNTPWNRGLSNWMSEEQRESNRQRLLGHTPWNKGKKIASISGKNNPMWRGGVKSENEKGRARFRKYFQPKVLKRDNYTCQICYQYSGYLQVDHIKSWADHPQLRFDLDNCRTLCMACHYYITFKKKIPTGIVWGHNFSKRIAS